MTIDFGLFLKFLGAVSRWVETLVCFAQKKNGGNRIFPSKSGIGEPFTPGPQGKTLKFYEILHQSEDEYVGLGMVFCFLMDG